jgi:UPF0755 protein
VTDPEETGPGAVAPKERPAPPRSERRRVSGRVIAASVAVLVVLVAAGVWGLLLRNESGLASGSSVQVEIPPKAHSAEIARILADKGVVPNALMFRIFARLSGGDASLKAGTYDMTTGMGLGEVEARLTKGPAIVYWELPVPEGWTIDQIAARVGARTDVSAQDFATFAKTKAQDSALLSKYPFLRANRTESLEGYLFPKTYQVKAGSTSREIVEMMVAQFGRETADLDLSVPRGGGLTAHDVVTVASMIEREARVPAERPVIASVIYNRLARGMLLEIDATVLYIVGNKTKLLYRDLRVDNPYNTYVVKGLPPGPIASPGLASLQAACRPSSTGYYFYVRTGKDGSHTFTQTKAEFLAAKAQAKKGLK